MTYTPKLPYFEYVSKDTEKIREFERFIMNNVYELFSNADLSNFKVRLSDIDMRSVVNSGAHGQVLKQLANTIHMTASNNSKYKNIHQQSIFHTILKESKGKDFKIFMRNIKKYLSTLKEEIYRWNVVWYGTYKEGVHRKW